MDTSPILHQNFLVKNSEFGNNYYFDDWSLFSFYHLNKVIISECSFYVNLSASEVQTKFVDYVDNTLNHHFA